MFIEPNKVCGRRGSIEVVCGPMFGGKTEELIRRLKRAKLANLRVEIFKPAIDKRYDKDKVVSHDANAIQSTVIRNSREILRLAKNVDVVGIDEAQFFDTGIVPVCEKLVSEGVRVIVGGLDMDYLGKPFGPMPQLLSIADYVTKLQAICMVCGNIANMTYRKSATGAQIVVGEKDKYEARCRECYTRGMKEQKQERSASRTVKKPEKKKVR